MKTNTSSLLILQVPLYFNGWYLLPFYVGELGLLCYKGIVLPYPARNFWPELLLILLLLGIDVIRIFLGMKGNLTQRKIPLLVSLLLLLPIIFGYLYFILWQSYIFIIELVLIIIAFVGIGLQACISPIILWILHRQQS